MILRNLIDGVFYYIILLNLTAYFVQGNVKTFNYKINTLMLYKDRVYVGGTNRISRLNTELNILAETSNGPVLNSKYCYPSSLDKLECFTKKGNFRPTPEDNINKILLYSEKPIDMVIACGSIYQGICQFLDINTLANISEIYQKSIFTNRIVAPDKYVSSNGPNASATAFISYSNTEVYLVNAKTITVKPIISSIPAISALPLGLKLTDDKFFVDANSNSKIEYNGDLFFDNNTAKYNVDYKSSFQLGGFVYFTTVQKNLQEAKPSTVSKIIEIKFDVALTGYVEIPLHCEKGGIRYNIIVSSTVAKLNSSDIVSEVSAGEFVLFGVFKSTKLGKYAVCSFTFKEIQSKTEEIRKKCRNSGISKEITVPWSSQSERQLCSGHQLRATTRKVIGTFWLKSNEKIGAIFGFTHPRGFSLYLTYPSHRIDMIDVTSNDFYKFGEEKLSGDGLFTKIALGSKKYLFAISTDTLGKIDITKCESRTSCKDCLSGPSCGWCVLDARCTQEEKCSSSKKANYFIKSSHKACPIISNIQPNVIAKQDSKSVKFTVKNIPVDVTYKCAYNNKESTVDAKVDGTTAECSTVDFNKLNIVATEKGDSKVEVSLVYGQAMVVSSRLTVYDCSSLKMCTSCITGLYNCGWCSKAMTCTTNLNSCQGNFVSYLGENSTKYVDHCPQIVDIEDRYLPNDVERSISVVGKFLPPEDNRSYQCHIKIDGNVQTTTAKFKSPTKLVCDKKAFKFSAEDTVSARLEVYFGSTPIFSNNLKVNMYKCEYKRKDCSSCLVANKLWQCGWCSLTSTCGVQENCKKPITKKCPSPVITDVTPNEISVGGNTTIVIEGTDLGVTAEHVLSVKLAGVPCSKTSDTKQNYIVCTSGFCPSIKACEGPVSISVNTSDGIKNGIYKSFFYRAPFLDSISPEKGTCSGGTSLTLEGTYLNVANEISVSVGEISCINVNATRNKITCQTSPRDKCKAYDRERRRRRNIGENQVKVLLDGYEVPTGVGYMEFSYEKDPVIYNLYTNKKSIHPKLFTSGGQVIILEGARLDVIQNPKIFFSTKSPMKPARFEVSCKYNGKHVICLSPNVTEVSSGGVTSFSLSTDLQLDGYKTDYSTIQVVPDPVFDKLPDGGTLVVKTDDLILEGRRLESIVAEDVKVKVAGIACNVTDLDKRLVCTLPPKDKVLSASPFPDKAPIKVYIGEGGLSYDLGFIVFYTASMSESSIELIIGISVGVICLIIILIIVGCYILKRRRKQKDKRYHALVQLRMDRMESQYARECKEAFAEYQTEITDLTYDVDQVTSPYLKFPQYAMRVLYPGLTTHPILQANKNSRPEWESSMRSLIELLKEKEFLVNFIRTLEGQSSFQLTDRCIVASLLMVSLQDNLRYITEILTELLKDLINKPGKRPKLLLRRTESVAEKLLTNWLAYTLHNFLDDHVGLPLFNLFTAINILLEKEPVDAITSDARNSLSEDKLLRQKIDFTSISLNVEYIGEDENSQQVNGIPVLTCDTITQTKEKIIKFIYKNKPFSSWPVLEDLELGFPSANGAVLVLKDEDSSSLHEGEWKRLNTLDHYKVPDKSNLRLASISTIHGHNTSLNDSTAEALVAVSPPTQRVYKTSLKRRISHSLRSIQDIGKSETALSNNISLPSVNFSTSTPMLHHVDNNELKLWHIVKTSDYPQEQKEQKEQKEDIRHSKMMAEVFLTRLLKTKETLQLFVNKLFDSIFGLYEGGRKIPPSVKYLFDFLDRQASELDIGEEEVRHTWKNNSLPLRFWINIIKNPNFVFDINKSNTVDSCLSVIAQLFMDSCSPDEHRLGKDSPSNKLLYAKEIPEYKKKVKSFYEDVSQHEQSEEDFLKLMDEISQKHGSYFNSCNAARELMGYAEEYKVQLMENLERNNQSELYDRLQDIMTGMPDD